jgi:hypothetical protein
MIAVVLRCWSAYRRRCSRSFEGITACVRRRFPAKRWRGRDPRPLKLFLVVHLVFPALRPGVGSASFMFKYSSRSVAFQAPNGVVFQLLD